jgi:F-type H+-transporting ATPase subunit b
MTRFTWLSAFTFVLCAGLVFPAGAQEKSGETKAAETKAAESKSEPAHDPVAASKAAGATKAAEEDHPAAEGAKGEAHADHGGHDEHALEHGDASPALASPADLRFDLSIYTLIVFLILLAVLYKFAWAPIAAGLEKREQTIAKQIADAEHASAMAAKQLQEYERKLAAATEEARAIVTQARQDAITAKDKIVAEAQSAAAKERDRAVAEIASAKNQALREIAQQSVTTAISLASNIIRREVKPEDHDKLIADSLSKFSNLN